MNHKKILPLLMFSLLIISGCDVKPQNSIIPEKPGKTSSDANKPSVVVDWKDYQSSGLRIKLKYPSGWKLADNGTFINIADPADIGKMQILTSYSGYAQIKNNTDGVASSSLIKINGRDATKRWYKKSSPDDGGASANICLLRPLDGEVCVLNFYKDSEDEVLNYIANSIEFVSSQLSLVPTTTAYSIKKDPKNHGFNIFEDRAAGFRISYPDPLQFVSDMIYDNNIFVVKFPVDEGRELSNFAQVFVFEVKNEKNESLNKIAVDKATAENVKKVYPCKLGEAAAECFNAKEYYNDIEISNYYSEEIYFQHNGKIYGMYFFSSGNIKNKFENIFTKIKSDFSFVDTAGDILSFEKSSIAGEKMLVSRKFGFEFEMPSDAKVVVGYNEGEFDFTNNHGICGLKVSKYDDFDKNNYEDVAFNKEFDNKYVLGGINVIEFNRPYGHCDSLATYEKVEAMNDPLGGCGNPHLAYRFLDKNNQYFYTITFCRDVSSGKSVAEKMIIGSFKLLNQ